jgi:hypothetical protein
MAVPTQDTTHVAEAAALLIEQYKNTTVVGGFAAVFARQIQTLENAVWSVLNSLPLSAQPLGGPTNWDILDKIGAIVGIPRNGLADIPYLAAIKIKIRINRSDGLAEDIIQITALLFTGAVYREWYPASWEIDLEGAAVTNAIILALTTYLHEAKAAGTGGNIRSSALPHIWIWDSTTGHLAIATGLDDHVTPGQFPNAPVSLQSV